MVQSPQLQVDPSTALLEHAEPIGRPTIKILIVDDEPKNLTVLETILDEPDYKLVRAESADEALLALVQEEFALLILDIRMPDMTGFELAQMVKQRKKTAHVPIIFLTAYYNEDQHVLEGYGSGAVDYLHKPVNPAILKSKVAVFATMHRNNLEREAAHRALVAEVAERRAAEEQLRILNETLEQRVVERSDALQENEAILRTVTNEAQVGLVMVDQERRYVFANHAYTRILGLPDDEVVGRLVPDVLHHIYDQVGPRLDLALAGERVRFELRVPATTRANEDRLYEVVYQPHHFAPAGPCVIVVVVDITERKRAELALKEADRRKDEFLATLAHELRNPLAPIRSGLEVMRLSMDSKDTIEKLRATMERQTRQLVRLIDDLLDVSRITIGKLELRKVPVTVEEIALNAVEVNETLLQERRQELTLDLPTEKIVLQADPHRLTQILSNLVNNSVKYTPEGGRIHLAACRQGDELTFTVRDNGLGIPPEMIERIFQIFVQVANPMEKTQSGLGIGLTLVKSLVEMHGGQISVSSAGLGHGSEFTVRLPITPVQEDTMQPPPTPESTGAKASRRVLVVDDNQAAAEMLSMLVSMVGHEVRTAFSGRQAIEIAEEFDPELVLMDLGMPGMSGYEAAEEIRKHPWGQKMMLVAVTGWGQESAKEKTRESGFNQHVVKPIGLPELEFLFGQLAAGASSQAT